MRPATTFGILPSASLIRLKSGAKDLLLPRQVRPWPILSGPLRGRRIMTSWCDYPTAILGIAERSLLKWLRLNVHAGETWIDVGAYVGYTAIAMAECVGASGRVFAFEPMEAAVSNLRKTADVNRFPHIQVMPVALGNRFAHRTTATFRGMAYPVDPPSKQDVTIETASLDLIWPTISGQPIAGVKMDVNGSEMEALAGMRHSLIRYRPKLVIEIHKPVDRGEFLTLLRDGCGYKYRRALNDPTNSLLDDHCYEFEPV